MNPANPMLWRSVAAALFGVFQALPLLHVMHDSSHTSLGHSQWWWTIVGKGSFDLLAGGSLNSWIHQHVLGHHLYTNVITVDPDLPAEFEGDVRRVMDRQSYSWIYALQWIYLPILYGVLAIKFRIQDIQLLFSHMNGAVRVNKIPTAEWVRQFAAKALVITWRVLVPIFMWELPVKHVLLLNLLAEYMTGIYLTYNFQVSHVSPQLIWPDVNKPQFDLCWAETQIATTVDYAHDNTITTLLCGALNYQTIHHLFPAVSQYHYPALAPIVKRVCKKHGVKFNYLPDFTTAFLAHLRQLWIMGWNRVAEHMD
jgi:fatty acid desaturase